MIMKSIRPASAVGATAGIAFVVAAFVCLSGCKTAGAAGTRSDSPPKATPGQPYPEEEKIAREYVLTVKRWSEHDFKIRFEKAVSDSDVVFRVVHKDDTGPIMSAGGGKSIEVVVDSKLRKVVREFRFQ